MVSGGYSSWSLLSNCPVSLFIAVFMALDPVNNSSLNLVGMSAVVLLMQNKQKQSYQFRGNKRIYSKLNVTD